VFVSGDDAGTLTMWSASTGRDDVAVALDRGAAVSRAHDACISSICVVADKSRFVTAGADARVRVWDAERARRAEAKL
jgi:WD40 repeat protein